MYSSLDLDYRASTWYLVSLGTYTDVTSTGNETFAVLTPISMIRALWKTTTWATTNINPLRR